MLGFCGIYLYNNTDGAVIIETSLVGSACTGASAGKYVDAPASC